MISICYYSFSYMVCKIFKVLVKFISKPIKRLYLMNLVPFYEKFIYLIENEEK